MKRRDFLKQSTIAAGLVSSSGLLSPLKASESNTQKPSQTSDQISGSTSHAKIETRSAEYLSRVQKDELLPKPPVFTEAPANVKIKPMPLEERIRRKIVPQKGFCSITPGGDVLISGNGSVNIELACDPYTEQIPFSHESLFVPHSRPFEAPKIAEILPQVRQMLLDGKYHEAAQFAYNEWHKSSMTQQRGGFGGNARYSMRLDFPKTESIKDYLRTVDFESTEIKVHWMDEQGEWVRRIFTSRPDNVVVQWLIAPKGQSVNVRITVSSGGGGIRGGRSSRGMRGGMRGGSGMRGRGGGQNNVQQDFNEQWLILKGILDPSVSNSGYAGVTRVVRDGGSASMDGDSLVIENASSVMLLTRIEHFTDYSEEQVEATRLAVEQLKPDYEILLERARKVQSEMLNRVTVDFGGASEYAMSCEELFSAQRSSSGYSAAFLEKLFDMCRYWFIITSGKYRSVSALTNININLQIAPMALGYHREGEEAYFNWIESLVPDFRTNAKNVYGFRGTLYPIAPSKDSGVATQFDHSGTEATGETWPHPYWLAAGGWCVRPFWDHYLVTGDMDFLRNHVVPAYKDLALFYEDFLTVTDKNGKYIFVPSFSPENNPGSLNPSCMMVINANMDIAVCREVLSNLVEACELLGIESGNLSKWKEMIAKLPPYLLEPDGTLKEWAWPTLGERYVHRHVSHLYGAWPGDEIDPDRTPQLAKSALMADRRRVPERLAAHSRCHRALVGARLKDRYMVDSELRQLVEEGLVGTTFRCSHDPYSGIMPDAQGGIPTIMMEMLAYSRPGVIEVLPALPPSLIKGSINGMLLRTFARLNKLAWDMEARTVGLTVTSQKKQNVTLIARYGIEEITGPSDVLASKPQPNSAACDLQLPERKPVEIHLKIGLRNTLEWVNWVA
ncbi:MAG: glycoside hydrolase N-terminal domain-containing protein [Sedimentisphaerales bacterium]